MKRLLILCFTALLLFGLAACGTNDGSDAVTYEVKVLNDTYTLIFDGEEITVSSFIVDSIDNEKGITATLYQTQNGTVKAEGETTVATLNEPTYHAVFEGEGADEVIEEWKNKLTEAYENGELSEESYRKQYDLYDGKEITGFDPYYWTEITLSFDAEERPLILRMVRNDGAEQRYTYHENGVVETHSRYYDGRLDSTDRYDSNGNYLGAVDLNAEYTYYDNGQPKTIITRYEDGTTRNEKHYAEDGTLLSETAYYDNGNIESESSFYTDGSVKTQTDYNDDGTLSRTEENSEDGSDHKVTYYDYENGGCITTLRSYWIIETENGVETSYITYDPEGNILSSISYEYYDSGELKKQIETDADGVLISESEFYEKGNIKCESDYDNGTLKSRYEYDEGGMLVRRTYPNGDGSEELCVEEYAYNEAGQIVKTTNYQNDVLINYTDFEYYDEGTIRKKTTFNGNDTVIALREYTVDGTCCVWEAYHDNGALAEKKEYDEEGNLMKEETYDENGTVLKSLTYDENGNTLREFYTYENGDTSLRETAYNEEGVRIFYASYRNDLPVQKYEYYDNGSYKAEYSYHQNGQLYQELHRHENGNYSVQGSYNEDGSLVYYCEMNEYNKTTLAKFPRNGDVVRQEFTYRDDGSFVIDHYDDATNAFLYSQEYDADGNLLSQTNP